MSDIDADLARMQDLATMATEELHDDLKPHVYNGALGSVLQHPLVYQVPFSLPGLANLAYEHKTKAVTRALEEGDHHSYVFLHERPYRFEAMMTALLEMQFEGNERWALTRDVWIDSENIWQHLDEWIEIMENPGAPLMMLDDEKVALAALPEQVPVYRGAKLEINEEGLSYTLDRPRAEWFACRFASKDEPSVVICATVPRERIVALLHGRGEDEVVILPEHVAVDHYEEIS